MSYGLKREDGEERKEAKLENGDLGGALPDVKPTATDTGGISMSTEAARKGDAVVQDRRPN